MKFKEGDLIRVNDHIIRIKGSNTIHKYLYSFVTFNYSQRSSNGEIRIDYLDTNFNKTDKIPKITLLDILEGIE